MRFWANAQCYYIILRYIFKLIVLQRLEHKLEKLSEISLGCVSVASLRGETVPGKIKPGDHSYFTPGRRRWNQ